MTDSWDALRFDRAEWSGAGGHAIMDADPKPFRSNLPERHTLLWYTVRANLGTVRCCFGSDMKWSVCRGTAVRPEFSIGTVMYRNILCSFT